MERRRPACTGDISMHAGRVRSMTSRVYCVGAQASRLHWRSVTKRKTMGCFQPNRVTLLLEFNHFSQRQLACAAGYKFSTTR